MFSKILLSIGILMIVFVLIAIYSCFIMSGRMSEAERQRDINMKE